MIRIRRYCIFQTNARGKLYFPSLVSRSALSSFLTFPLVLVSFLSRIFVNDCDQ